MGPKMKILRQLKTLRIQHSRVPNIGRKTLWGLSGLEILDLRWAFINTSAGKKLSIYIRVIQVRTDQGLVVKIRCPVRP